MICPPWLEIVPEEEAVTGLAVEFVEPAKIALLLTTALWPFWRTIEYSAGDEGGCAKLKEGRLDAMANSLRKLPITTEYGSTKFAQTFGIEDNCIHICTPGN